MVSLPMVSQLEELIHGKYICVMQRGKSIEGKLVSATLGALL